MVDDKIKASDLPTPGGQITHVLVQDEFGSVPVRSPIDQFASEIGNNLGTVGGIGAATWAELNGIAGSYVGQPATVSDSDTGNHTDPVVGGTKQNSGVYSWRISPATGWRWDGRSAVEDEIAERESLISESDTANKNGLWMVGENNIPFAALTDGELFFADRDLAAKNARNLAWGRMIAARIVTEVPAITANYNLLVSYPEQSFGIGAQGWPAMWSSSAPADFYDSGFLTSIMSGIKFIGDDVRPKQSDEDDYIPVGSSHFGAAKTNVMDGDTIMTASDVAALDPASGTPGETPVLNAAVILNQLALQSRELAVDPDRILVPVSCGLGGRALSELLDSASSPHIYGRFTDAIALGESLATGAGKTSQCIGFLHVQGQGDYLLSGAAATRADYLDEERTIYADMTTAVLTEFGQLREPAIFMYMHGGNGYIKNFDGWDTPDHLVAAAQYEYARSNRGRVFLIGPDYHTTDKINHPDSNGYRWLGLKAGMVAHRVFVQRRGWEPCRVIGTELYRGRRVLDVHIHAPEPPLVIRGVYDEGTLKAQAAFPQWGFDAWDSKGYIGLTPSFVGDTIIRLVLDHDPIGPGGLFVAGERTSGYSIISDSERTDPLVDYLYKSGSGQFATADIAALENNPYKMANFLCPGFFPYNWEATAV